MTPMLLFALAVGQSVLAQPADQAAAEESNRLDAAELERRGAIIGAITIRIDNVFDLNNPGENRRLYRWANGVHVTTLEGIVDSIILFESGDAFQARLLSESARLLRSRGFTSDATAIPVRYDEATNTVDVEVWVHDSWSLKPSLKISRSGGENEYGIGIEEENLFGTGKNITASYSTDVDRDELFFGYSDLNINGGRIRLDLGLANTSDGDRIAVSAGRPFFALDTRWSITGNVLDEQRVDSIYELGEVIDEFRHDTRALSIRGGRARSFGDGSARRLLGGLDFEEDKFLATDVVPQPLLLPEDRKLVYPWVGMQFVEDDFREMTELNDMGRTEDIALGLNLFFSLGYASKSLGSDRDAAIFSASVQKGWEPGGPGRLFLLDAAASTRVEDDGARNSIIVSSARYFHRNLGNNLFLASLRAALGNELDAENQVLLGGDSGLRGYPLRYQSGERSAVLTLEQRFFTEWYPFRLLRFGYAVFLDAGRVWGTDRRGTQNLGTLYDVGVGLRLTSPRSSGRSVIHIDLAFPLNGDQSIDGVQLLVEKRASF